jgi:hypothetical protein
MEKTEALVEPVLTMSMRVRMATMRIRRKKHLKLMMNQRGMWRTAGIVLESVKIRQDTSDL